MFFVLRPFRFLAQALTDQNTPRQIALGFAMGLVVGLVPKDNLIAVVLMSVLCATKVNLGAGMLAAIVFSWVGMLTDPLTHRIGLSLLTAETLKPTWTALYDLPLMPWIGFNNTVVLGSLLLGLTLLYPALRLSEPVIARYKPQVEKRLKNYKIAHLLWGTEWAGKLGTQ